MSPALTDGSSAGSASVISTTKVDPGAVSLQRQGFIELVGLILLDADRQPVPDTRARWPYEVR